MTELKRAEPRGSGLEVAMTRAAQEIQAAMVIAQRFPRNEDECRQKILAACRRPQLAEVAQYSYPKGGKRVTGPSIRLAEVAAGAWRNMDYGLVELERDRKKKVSTMMAYAWDLETNVRSTRIFDVPLKIDRKGGARDTRDSREEYELTANQGARRMRACILQVIPGDVMDDAVAEVQATLQAQGGDVPLEERRKRMADAFHAFGVTVGMLEEWLGHELRAIDEAELVELRGIYQSIKDGMSSREQWFNVGGPPAEKPTTLDDLKAGMAAALEPEGVADAEAAGEGVSKAQAGSSPATPTANGPARSMVQPGSTPDVPERVPKAAPATPDDYLPPLDPPDEAAEREAIAGEQAGIDFDDHPF